MKTFYKAIVATLLASPFTASAGQIPTVIYDSGKTYPIKHKFKAKVKVENPPIQKNLLNIGFPLEPTTWKVGSFDLIPKGIPALPVPFFIVGCNQESMDWIDYRKDALIHLHALGYVIDCKDRATFAKLEEFAHPVKLTPSHGDELSQLLDHDIYPAIITKKSIEQ